MLRSYDRTLQMGLRHRVLTMATFVAVFAATIWMFGAIPKGFIPDQDTDQLFAVTESQQGTSYYEMAGYQGQGAEIVRQNPNVEAFVSTVGGTSSSQLGGPNYGQLLGPPKPRSPRTPSGTQLFNPLPPK